MDTQLTTLMLPSDSIYSNFVSLNFNF